VGSIDTLQRGIQMKGLRLAFLLIAVLAATWFAVGNAMPVTVTLFFWHLQASLAIVIAGCFVLGCLVGAVALLPALYRSRVRNKRLAAENVSLRDTSHGIDIYDASNRPLR
jgi:putative membrane protein